MSDNVVWWSSNPDEWPHTPPLHIYRKLEEKDSNLFWRMGSGHALNLLGAAIERVDELERGRSGAVAPEDVDRLVEIFREAWKEASRMGDYGNRVRRGLLAVFSELGIAP